MKQLIELAESKGYKAHFLYSEDKDYEWPISSYCELCLIQKWLREEMDYEININFIIGSKYNDYYIRTRVNGVSYKYTGLIKTYEEALKEGIKKAFELIK